MTDPIVLRTADGADAVGTCEVSVVIAAYMAQDFLERAVCSALAQADDGIVVDVIVVDDASSDATGDIARRLAMRDPRVRVFTLAENSGPSGARNLGFRQAAGRWIAILDADDIFEPGHLSHLMRLAMARNANIVLANIAFYYGPERSGIGSSLLAPAHDGPIDIVEYVRNAQPLSGGTDWGLLKPMFERAFVEAAAIEYPEASRHGEDFLILFDALLKGARLFLSLHPSYRYTERGVGWSRTRIDYRDQIAHVARLAREPRVGAITGLRSALEGRARALRRLIAKRLADRYYEERKVGPVVREAARAHALLDVVALLIVQKVRHLRKSAI